MAQNNVTIVFNKQAFTFTRQSLEQKVKRMAKQNTPTMSALHKVYLPGLKDAVSPNWAATYILDTAPVTVNKEQTAMRGAYNPAQVLRAFSQMAAIGVKVESLSPSLTYAPYSKVAAQNLKAEIARLTGKAQKQTPRKARKVKQPENKQEAGGEVKQEA